MKVYYITFRPIRGISASVDYEYNIIINGRLLPWDDPDEPEFTDLLGAESPITLREDDSDDLFAPIRTQSGYIRFYDNGVDGDGDPFDFTKLIPAGYAQIPVTLWLTINDHQSPQVSGDYCLWKGFMSPDQYTAGFMEGTTIRQMSISCAITALKAKFYTPTLPTAYSNQPSDLITFGELLYATLGINGDSFDSLYFCCGNADQILSTRVSKFLFAEIAENPYGTYPRHGIKPTWKCYDILEAFCKFFGFTCRQYWGNLYFVAPDDLQTPNIMEYTWSQLSSFPSGSITPTTDSMSTTIVNLDNIRILKSSTFDYKQGYKRVTVSMPTNENDEVFKYPADILKQVFYDVQPSTDDPKIYYKTQGYYDSSMYLDGYQCKYYDQWKSIIRARAYDDQLGGGALMVEWVKRSTYNSMSEAQNENVSSCALLINNVQSNFQYNRVLADVLLRETPICGDGMVVINANAYCIRSTAGEKTPAGNGEYLQCRLVIETGDIAQPYYWSEAYNAWVNTPNTFNLHFVDGKVKGNYSAQHQGYKQYEGYGVPMLTSGGKGVNGQVRLEILGWHNASLNDPSTLNLYTKLYLEDLTIKVNKDVETDRYNSSLNEIVKENQTTFTDEKTVALPFIQSEWSKNAKELITAGNALSLFMYDYTNEGVSYQESAPEHLANRMLEWGGKIRLHIHFKQLAGEPIADYAHPLYFMKYEEEIGGETVTRTLYPLAYSKDYANLIYEVHFVEIKNVTS